MRTRCEVVRLTVRTVEDLYVARFRTRHVSANQTIVTPNVITGMLAVHLPSGVRLPEWLLQSQGWWNQVRQHGTLSGEYHDVVSNEVHVLSTRIIKTSGVLMFGTHVNPQGVEITDTSCGLATAELAISAKVFSQNQWVWQSETFRVGENVAEFLGV